MRVRAKLEQDAETMENGQVAAGQEYFVLEVDSESFRIVNEHGEPILYTKALFEVTDEAIPPDWHFFEPELGDYYLSPRRASRPGFYEDYFGCDCDTAAQFEVQATLREVLVQTLAWGTEADRAVLQRDMERMARYEEGQRRHPGWRW